MTNLSVSNSKEYLLERLLEMLAIPSPTGFTDEISRYLCQKLKDLNIRYSLTRRGIIIASVSPNNESSLESRAVAAHLDTIGAAVSEIKENGRVGIRPIGTWSSRFAEGGRVTIFTKDNAYRGQVLPLLASGHAFNEKIDELPVGWDTIEVRVNEFSNTREDLNELGIRPGDFVVFDSDPEVEENGFITARHLDNKAGVASLMTALSMINERKKDLKKEFQAIFTVSEEVGTGAGSTLSKNVTELIGIDIGPVAPNQNAKETGVTLCAKDTSGPFNHQLLELLKKICKSNAISYQVDVFKYYYSDANSAACAGHDVRDALITFGTDATHGYERTNMDSLLSIVNLIEKYAFSD